MLFAIRCLHGENIRAQSMRALAFSLSITGAAAEPLRGSANSQHSIHHRLD